MTEFEGKMPLIWAMGLMYAERSSLIAAQYRRARCMGTSLDEARE